MLRRECAEIVANIVREAGGTLIGRTKLQKIAYLLKSAGFCPHFHFQYHHYGPYSEDLSMAVQDAELLSMLQEKVSPTSWGGEYATYHSDGSATWEPDDHQTTLIRISSDARSIELELAATAVYLSQREMSPDPWGETARRKPEKADKERLIQAKNLYRKLREAVPELPVLPE